MNLIRALAMLPALLAIALAVVLLLRTRRLALSAVSIGSRLSVQERDVAALYKHDLQATRCLEQALADDRTLPSLTDEVRVEAERLVKAFYDDKGD